MESPFISKAALHVNDQSKNGEMYSDSTPSFLLFTLLRFACGSKLRKWNVGVAFSGKHAGTRWYARTNKENAKFS